MSPLGPCVKKVPDVEGIGVRERLPGTAAIGDLLGDGFAALSSVGVLAEGPPIAVYHDPDFSPRSIDLELVYPVPGWLKGPLRSPAGRSLERRTVRGGLVAAIVHRGRYDNIGESYQLLTDWIDEFGYRIEGPPREVYLSLPLAASLPSTEILIPVAKERAYSS